MFPKVDIGVSRCLLGEKVRYDGGHKLDSYVVGTVGPLVRFHPVCPEVECGLPVPREAMRLTGDPSSPRLVTRESGVDHTERMRQWASGKLEELADLELCGFIFKSKSPSSGMERIKVYDGRGMPKPVGRGIFAGMFMDRFPLVPVEDEGRLNDPGLRENFFIRVFAFRRWLDLLQGPRTLGSLVDFHTRHKLLLLAHHPVGYRELGRLAALGKGLPVEDLYTEYLGKFMASLKYKSTPKKHVNVLQHALGYFKKQRTPDEKQEMLEVIGEYHRELTPLVAPMALLNHHVRKYGQPYLQDQVYLRPHPVELRLRGCP